MLILICSQFGEAQVAEVSRILDKKKVTPVIFERYRKDHLVSFSNQKNKMIAKIKIADKDYPLDSNTFGTVWYRTKPIIRSEIPGENPEPTEKFCFYEWQNVLHSFEYFLAESKWINLISKSREAARKLYQLKVANEIGLLTPDTVVTNNYEDVLPLFKHKQVIYKSLTAFFTKTQALYTNVIDKKSVENGINAIAIAPGIYQAMIQKKYELRCTVIGEQVFTVKINSQKYEQSAIDWRRFPYPDIYEVGDLSSDTKNKLIKFHKKMGLIYAAYDFVVDGKDNEIFLECNPNGQWLWLENKLQLSISEAMANILMGDQN